MLASIITMNHFINASTKKYKPGRKEMTRKEKKESNRFATKVVPLKNHLVALWTPSLPFHRESKRTACNELIRVQPWSGLLRETVFSQAEPLHCRLSNT